MTHEVANSLPHSPDAYALLGAVKLVGQIFVKQGTVYYAKAGSSPSYCVLGQRKRGLAEGYSSTGAGTTTEV
jgi:hypothetical protein